MLGGSSDAQNVQQQATAEMMRLCGERITDDGGAVKVWAEPKLAMMSLCYNLPHDPCHGWNRLHWPRPGASSRRVGASGAHTPASLAAHAQPAAEGAGGSGGHQPERRTWSARRHARRGRGLSHGGRRGAGRARQPDGRGHRRHAQPGTRRRGCPHPAPFLPQPPRLRPRLGLSRAQSQGHCRGSHPTERRTPHHSARLDPFWPAG